MFKFEGQGHSRAVLFQHRYKNVKQDNGTGTADNEAQKKQEMNDDKLNLTAVETEHQTTDQVSRITQSYWMSRCKGN